MEYAFIFLSGIIIGWIASMLYDELTRNQEPEKQSAPDCWSTAPDWANWRAMDAGGRWYLFENKPIKSGTCWLKTTGQWALDYYEDRPWESSLQQRPQNKEK